LKGRDLIAVLRSAGFVVSRVNGSHHFLRYSDGRCTVVPVYAGETIGAGLLGKILDDVEMTADELVELL
jgi:predicted RNA binding protein YcfA (HicA-like mRNA interferase family)